MPIQEGSYQPSPDTRAALRALRNVLVEQKPRLTPRERAALANVLEHVGAVAELARRGKANGVVLFTVFTEGEVSGPSWERSVNRLVESLLR